jgi:hypothetical protein
VRKLRRLLCNVCIYVFLIQLCDIDKFSFFCFILIEV